MTNTDKPATNGNPKHTPEHDLPQPGLNANPGITGEVFTESHPYIKYATEKAKEAVEVLVYKPYKKIPTKKVHFGFIMGTVKMRRQRT